MQVKSKYYVYILECSDGSLYTGICKDLIQRLNQHNGKIKGGAVYTRSKRPVTLKYSEEFKNRSGALKREHEIKKLSRADKFKLLPAPASSASSTAARKSSRRT